MIDPFFRLCQEEEETTQVEETEETPEELPRVPRDASTDGHWCHQKACLNSSVQFVENYLRVERLDGPELSEHDFDFEWISLDDVEGE